MRREEPYLMQTLDLRNDPNCLNGYDPSEDYNKAMALLRAAEDTQKPWRERMPIVNDALDYFESQANFLVKGSVLFK